MVILVVVLVVVVVVVVVMVGYYDSDVSVVTWGGCIVTSGCNNGRYTLRMFRGDRLTEVI